MILNSLYAHYDGVGAETYTSSLPNQARPDNKKGENFKKIVMDRLEAIGINQLSKNIEFREYYKMVEGRLVYADHGAPPGIMKDISAIREDLDLPTYIKHYDIIGLIANQMAGELDSNKDKLRMDSTDEFAQNEYIRTKSEKLSEYQKQKFDFEIKRKLALKGIDPNAYKEFKTKEEKQEYLQFIQIESAKIISPEYIEKDLNKNFKVKAVEWAEKKLEGDTTKFGIDHMEEQEFIDYFLTGRFFRHYHVGYDYYKPESWRVETTFFSEDENAKYPQNGEYVGRITWMSASEIISRHGSKLPIAIQQRISKTFDSSTEGSVSEKGDYTTLDKRPVGAGSVPHKDYLDHQLHIQLQAAFEKPIAETTYVDSDGNTQTAPDWLSSYATNENYFGSNTAKYLRDDIDVRKDTFRVTEAYFKSMKRISYLRYETPSGVVAEEMLTDDLLKDFLKENDIRTIRNISVEDYENGDEVNVIMYTYIPEVWKGKKIGAGNGLISEDIYFDIEPLEFQIKGDSNLYDVKLPVSGIITNSQARKIRPYQMGYNLSMNQVFNLLEKEIGMFFLMDINFLPSEFKDMGDSAEILSELRELARDLGFMPVDTSRQNLQGQNAQAGVFQKQEISYDAQINRRAIMADMYKRQALEQIGITDQRKGAPDKYATNEGIKVGQDATYAQTRLIFNVFNEARRKGTELHINVAQFCESSKDNISLFTRKSDGDLAYLEFTDDVFPLRELNVTAVSNSKDRQSLERLRNTLLENNTAGSDILDFAEIMVSDSMVELVNIGKQSRKRKDKEVQEERNHEQQLLDSKIRGEAEESERIRAEDRNESQKDRDNELDKERIKALGRASDKESDQEGFDQINKATEQAHKKEYDDKTLELKGREVDIKEQDSAVKHRIAQETLRAKVLELKDKREQRAHEKFVAITNKN